VEDAVVLVEMLPEVLAALEEGRIGASQATVMVEQWRELIAQAPTWTSGERVPPPVEGTGPRSAGELRADVLVDLRLDEPDFPRGVGARVSVLVPVTLRRCRHTGSESHLPPSGRTRVSQHSPAAPARGTTGRMEAELVPQQLRGAHR
jgi:hypothetical protein